MKRVTVLSSMVIVININAAVLHVPEDYPTIQEALINATSGDTILVAPGTYYENIIWPYTPDIVLMSEYGPDSTIIDASGTSSVIKIDFPADTTTIITGFTIRNGESDLNKGGGIYCYQASPMICNNIICDNHAYFRGGGIYCIMSYAIIKNNVISGNISGSGGGIGLVSSTAKIIGNTITNNDAPIHLMDGGGIYALGETTDALEITNNVISYNTAAEWGGAMCMISVCVNIMYNSIHNNTSFGAGNGIVFRDCFSAINVQYNNIYDNGFCLHSDYHLIKAENNWWGDPTGPYHATNPGGLGDTVSDYVDFIPWQTGPYSVEEHTQHSISSNPYTLTISPNPVKQRCSFEYVIANETTVHMALYDASGKYIKKLLDERRNPGSYKRTFSLIDQAQGIYFVKLTTEDHTEVKKVILLK